jgi:hypothetical protein
MLRPYPNLQSALPGVDAHTHRQECLCYSFVAQGDDGVDVRGAASRDVAGG